MREISSADMKHNANFCFNKEKVGILKRSISAIPNTTLLARLAKPMFTAISHLQRNIPTFNHKLGSKHEKYLINFYKKNIKIII